MKIAAIIPASENSANMGGFKPLLPLGDGTVLSTCIKLFRYNCIKQVIVVTGHRADEVAVEARRAGAMPVFNKDYRQGILTSMVRGIRSLDVDVDAFFFLPIDMPTIRNHTVTRLVSAYRSDKPAVLYPRFSGQRGYPPLIGAGMIPMLTAHDGQGGLGRVLDSVEDHAAELDVADCGTVFELNQFSDYEQAVSRMLSEGPLDDECQQLWGIYDTPSNNIAHCQAVANVAEALGERLHVRSGAWLDMGLVRGGALTHDIGQGCRQHEVVGAQRLREHGFHPAARIALEHFDQRLEIEDAVSENTLVFLADKLVCGSHPAPLMQRYEKKLELHGHKPRAKKAILSRMDRAKAILTRVDREIGQSAEILAQEVLG